MLSWYSALNVQRSTVTSITLLSYKKKGHKGWQTNHVLATPLSYLLPHLFYPMEQQGTVKFFRSASPDLGSLRPIIAQRTARYDVVNKCVASIVNPFMKH
jgi:hypothetical protein